jgi:CDP-paratose 2-epimerase
MTRGDRRQHTRLQHPMPALKAVKPLLITGGAGFIGCNLADRLASEGEHVIVLDSLGRPGVERNMEWLRARHPERVTAIVADVRSAAAANVIRDVSGIFHFAAQVAVTASLQEPMDDFDVNVRGTLALLDATRRSTHRPPFVFASTNKVYGDLSDIALTANPDAYAPADEVTRRFGISEQRPLCFHTPYGCSKGAADQYVLDYARSFGLQTSVLRMSCVYGPHQFGTEDQGWVAHFQISALDHRPITIYGDGRQVRDILHVDDAVEAYIRLFRSIDRLSGRAFNLGGGPENAVSLRQVLRRIEDILGRKLDVHFAGWRPGDQRYYVSDVRAVQTALGLPPPRSYVRGIADLAGWLAQSRSLSASPTAVVEAHP